jgi:hypothetical protein
MEQVVPLLTKRGMQMSFAEIEQRACVPRGVLRGEIEELKAVGRVREMTLDDLLMEEK